MIDDIQNNDYSNKSEYFDFSNPNNQSNNSINDEKQLIIQNIEPILKQEDGYHYLFPKCHIFSFIEFSKCKKYAKFTCLYYNNKEISIKIYLIKAKIMFLYK